MRGQNHTAIILCLCVWTTAAAPVWAAGDYHGGNGTGTDPYQIATAAELIELGRHTEDYDSHFILTADIDMGINAPDGKIFRRAVIAPETDSVTSDFQGVPFTGTFDGNGFMIRNLTFQYTDMPYVGLFGLVAPSGTVANVLLENCSIQYAGFSFNGALAGENQGFIFNCAAGVVIEGSLNPDFVGGLVGKNSGEMVDCQTSGSILADRNVGGLVGFNQRGLIQQCSSRCTVIGNDWYIGGLVGRSELYSLVIYCYATGSVGGVKYVGGLVGYAYDSTISQCYATGSVLGTSNSAGFVGTLDYSVAEYCYSTGFIHNIDYGFTGPRNTSTTRVSDSFWDTDTSGTTSSVGGTGLTTNIMQKMQAYVDAGWDFETVWTMLEGETYPYFQWQQQIPIILCRNGLPYPDGDLNKDCVVNLLDFQTLAENWLMDIRQ